MTTTHAVVGGTGFIGRHYLEALLRAEPLAQVRVLVRDRLDRSSIWPRHAIAQLGDFATGEGLEDLVADGPIVVVLGWLAAGGLDDNVMAIERLVEKCRNRNVGRIVLCSTATVVGRSGVAFATEETKCRPITSYQATKLAVENALLKAAVGVEVAIIRPTAVFGRGGHNLVKMASDLRQRPKLLNWLHAAVAGRRRINLVPVETVADALVFLSRRGLPTGRFIVSSGNEPPRTYRALEKVMMAALGIRDYSLRPPMLPTGLMRLLLRLIGRDDGTATTWFLSERLRSAGFSHSASLVAAIERYAADARNLQPASSH